MSSSKLSSRSNNLGPGHGGPDHEDTAIRHYHPTPTHPSNGRPALLGSLPLLLRGHIVAALAEFAGTFFFLLLAFGATQAVNNVPEDAYPDDNDGDRSSRHHQQPVSDLGADPARLLFISLAFGASLAVHAWVFFRISGGQLNPAVSLALAVRGAVPWARAAAVMPAQLLGGIAAAGAVAGLLPGPLRVATRLGAGVSILQGLFVEVFLTALLVLTIFMLAIEKHRATCVAPLGIGLGLFMGQMMGVRYTGGSLNPARSFGPAVVTGSFDGYHWIYWVGPAIGALLAAGVHAFIKAVGYETVNEGQDSAGYPPAGYMARAQGIPHDDATNTRRTGGGGPYREGPSLESGERGTAAI